MIALGITDDSAQLYWVDEGTGRGVEVQVPLTDLLAWFDERPGQMVVMESRRSSHAWARRLTRMGHTVRLVPTRAVRPHVFGTTDSDAQGVWTASHWPEGGSTPIKSEREQVGLALNNLKTHLSKMRRVVLDEMRAVLHELGAPPSKRPPTRQQLLDAMASTDSELPEPALSQLPELLQRLEQVNAEVERFERSVRGPGRGRAAKR